VMRAAVGSSVTRRTSIAPSSIERKQPVDVSWTQWIT
jgi:hypothetical protein